MSSIGNVPATNTQGVYSPLPFSDTDSEEEVFNKDLIKSNDADNHVVSRKLTISSGQPNKNGQLVMQANSDMADYRPLSNSETSLNNGFGGRLVLLPSSPTQPEETKVDVGPSVRETKQIGWNKMSPIRKFCFVGSLLLCVFTVVGFLWVLPCDLEATCVQKELPPLDHAALASAGSWEALLQGIEVTGCPNLAQGRLVLTVRGPQPFLRRLTPGDPVWSKLGYGPFLPDRMSSGQAGGGSLALWPDTGALAWSAVTPGAAPTSADCDLIDVTGDGRHDCLITNPDWLLAALDPASGALLWFLHIHRDNSTSQSHNSSRRQRKPARLRFPPLKIRDVDNDGVPDLCALSSPLLSSSLDSFVLISGKRGNVIGRLVNVSGCVSLTGLELDQSDNTLAFTCINQAGAESVRIMAVEEIYLRAVNRSQQNPDMLPPLQKRQQPPKEVNEPTTQSGDGRLYILKARGHRLTVENRGVCPRCRSFVSLSDSRNNTLWSCQGKGERAMAPVTLHFSANRGSSSLSGFVLKFWQWPSASLTPTRTVTKRPDDALRLKRALITDDWTTDHAGVEEGVTPDIRVTRLKERILLITFNATDLHVINASQSDVAQICATPPLRLPGKEPICQPDLPGQQNSLMIADLDEDGSQELVSFTSTYVPAREQKGGVGGNTVTWELISKVKVIHLENELSKLA